MEGAQESSPTCVEATGPPIPMASTQEAEHTMEVDIGDMPQLASEDATAVTPEKDDMLTGDPTSVDGEMARLQVTPLKAMSPRMVKPRNRSHPPLCINEVLHMSPLNSLRGRKKKEDLGTTGRMPRQDQASLIIMSLYYCTRSHNGGGWIC